MRPKARTVEPAISVERLLGEIARCGHGVVTRRELLRSAVTAAEIKHRLATGALLRVYRGVYRVGHLAPSIEADYMAAVKACGDRALLSGRSAGHLFGLLRRGSPPGPEVTAPLEHRVQGVRVRRSRHMHPHDATTWNLIPITTVPRTLVDLAGVLDFDDLARACHEAEVRHRMTPTEVEDVLDRCPNRPGARDLRRILRGDAHVVLSTLEKRFLSMLRLADLPLPRTNLRSGTFRVDCRWPEYRLTVELDSYRYHHSRHAWERDRRREREARARGDEFRRYTWGDLFEERRYVLGDLRSLLRLGPRSPRSGR